jgi:predicted nuclease of restriction endonuclease-like (RecB) superfamily
MNTPINVQPLFEQVRLVIDQAQQQFRHTVNDLMVQSYWHIGRLIIEDEQGGVARAEYGKQTLNHLSKKLSAEYGKGFSPQSLWNFRQFYVEFPILSTAWRELRWSHYKILMRVKDPAARDWYANEAISQGWNVAALDRQVSTLFYERLLSSQDQNALRTEAATLIQQYAPSDPRDFIRDPYILEFIGAQPSATLYEKELESNLIQQLQTFLLELGKGFAFVARQKQLRVEGEVYFVDLVFYNYLLKCFLLVDLKVGKLTHQDVGQMDMYVRIFEEQYRGADDNPTLGLILCSERNEAVAKYSLLTDSQQLFASRYRAFLPTEAELQAELQRDRAVLENAISEGEA